MNTMKLGMGLVCFMAVAVLASAEDQKKEENKKKEETKEVVILIKNGGAHAKYIEEGQTEQKPVTVIVGQKVTWKNEKGNAPHTATSKRKDDGKELFHTGTISGDKSKSVDFDEAMYKKAGGQDGKDVELDYYCKIHGEENMKSKIILKPGPKKEK